MAEGVRKANGHTSDDQSHTETLICCLVCMDTYDKPRLLQCSHIFCQRCLLHHAKTYQNASNVNSSMKCPTCQSITEVPSNGLEELALNRSEGKTKSRRISVTTKETPSQFCDSCEARQLCKEAEYYCSKCNIDMCVTCKAIHDDHSVFKSHAPIHISNKDTMNLYCLRPTHNKAVCLYFCVTCCAPVCCVCIITEHGAHQTSKLSDAVGTRRDNLKSVLNSVGPRVEKMSARLRKLIHVCSSQKQRNNNSVCTTSPVVTNGNDLEMVTMNTRKDSNDNLDFEIRTVYTELEKLHRLYDISSKIVDVAQSRKLLSVYDDLMLRLQSVRDVELVTISDELVAKMEHEIDLIDGTHSNSHINSRQISPVASTNSLSERQMSITGTASNHSTPRHSNASQEESDSDQFMLFKPKLMWKLEKTRQDPGELWNPSGIAFRPNRGVIVAEYDIMNDKNNRLRLFDEYGNAQGVLAQGQIKPLGVACNRDGNFAVTDCDGKRVKIYNQDGHIVHELGKSQFGWPYGVTCNSKGQYIVSDPFHDTIHIFNHDGRKVKTFGTSGTQNEQFKNPFHLSTDSRDNIFISDSGNNLIKVFDPQGHFMYKSSDVTKRRTNEISRHKQKSSKLKGPRGVTIDMKDNIIVADDCGRVCLLDHLGKYVRNLLTEEETVKYPEALATNQYGSLAVTEWNPNNMFAVKIYNMYD